MDPSFSIVYGELKVGKSLDAIAAFPDAVYVAAPGALAAAEAVLGLPPRKKEDLQTFTAIRGYVESVPGSVDIVIDDATLIADRSAIAFEEKGLSGWDIWDAVLRAALRLRDALRRRGGHCVMTCHSRPAYVERGVRQKGCPSFQGQCARKIPAAADFLLRAEERPGLAAPASADVGDMLDAAQPREKGPPQRGWPMVYRTGLHPDWLQGSRYHIPDLVPMNLGEILRLAGFKIPRARGLEWQEPLVIALAARILEVGLEDDQKVSDAMARVLEAARKRFRASEAHAYWAVRDGYDRAVLRIAKNAQAKLMWGV